MEQIQSTAEITCDHLAAKDRAFAGVEGSGHFFGPCGPKHGASQKRLFDFVNDWLSEVKRSEW